MNKKFNRFISVVFCMILCFTTTMSSSVVANAATSTPGNNLSYTLDSDGTLTVTGTGAMFNFRRASLGTLTKVRPWANDKDKIKKVVIGEGVTNIGEFAFAECSELTEVQLPSTLKTICGSGAAGVVIGSDSTTNSGSYGAFRDCPKLTKINFLEGLETIETVAFRGCTALKDVELPNTVKTVGRAAFVGCTSLSSVKFSDSMTTVPEGCFYNCKMLRNIGWGTGITSVSQYAFYNTYVYNVDIPERIGSLGARAFANCVALNSVTIHNKDCTFGISQDGGLVFDNDGLNHNQELTLYGHTGSTTQSYAEKNEFKFESIDACAHTNTRTETVEATCDTPGVTKVICNDCGIVLSSSTIEATGHDYYLVSTDDQREINAHVINHQKCSKCGNERDVATHTEADDSGTLLKKYVWVEGYYNYECTATCTSAGRETYTCTVDGCGATQTNIVQRAGHTVSDWTVTKEPTCEETGTRTGHCSVCDQDVTEEIAATGHTYDDSTLIKSDDKSEEDGHIYKTYACKTCGKNFDETEHVNWIEGKYTSSSVNPTCTIDGLQTDTCSICGEKRRTVLPANGEHDWQVTEVIEPTCTVAGKTNYKCSQCGRTKSDDRVDALGHNYKKIVDKSTEPTCTEDGSYYYLCQRDGCSSSTTEPVTKLGHSPGTEYTIIAKETCTDAGKRSATCWRCGEYYEEEVAALGHEFEDVEVAVDDKPGHVLATPTCKHDGCNVTETASIKHKEWIEGYYTHTVITEATCITGEISRDKCTICNETKLNNQGAPLGHILRFVRVKRADNSSEQSTFANLSAKAGTDSTIGSIIGSLDVGSIPEYSYVYICKECASVESATAKQVWGMWSNLLYNKTADDRTGRYNTTYLDVNGDGFVNAKDYAKIKKFYEEWQRYEASKEQQ